MLDRTCLRSPERLALVYEQREWTYGQLCSAACSLRDRLFLEGLEPQKGPVAVRLDASDHSALCFLALLAGGFTVHLLDRGASSQRHRLSVCPSQALLTAHGQGLEVEGLPVFKVDEMQLDVAQAPESLRMSGHLDKIGLRCSEELRRSQRRGVYRVYLWFHWHAQVSRHPTVAHRALGPDGIPSIFHRAQAPRVSQTMLFRCPRRCLQPVLAPFQALLKALRLRIWYWQIPLMTGSTCVVWPNWQSQDISQLMQYFRRHRRGTRNKCMKSLAESHFEAVEVL